MTKKLLIIAAALAVTAMTFAACGSNDEADTSADTTISVSDTAAEETTAAESEEETEAETEDVIPEDSEELEIGEETEATEAVSDNALMPAVDKVLAESEWPMMSEITDATLLKEFFTLDPENANYKEMIVMQCPISAVMSEIIIIHAEDVAAAQADLDARRTKAIDVDAWYPEDQELAAASIVGTNGDYAYFVIGHNAAAAEQSINDYINAL